MDRLLASKCERGRASGANEVAKRVVQNFTILISGIDGSLTLDRAFVRKFIL